MTLWPTARLKDVLAQRQDVVPVDPAAEYPMAGVYSFGRGVFFRGDQLGQETSYKEFYRLHAGDLVLSRLFGWEGAVGVVPEALDGHFVSKEFPSFFPVDGRVDVRFLLCFLSSRSGQSALLNAAAGLGQRRKRVKEKEFLQIEVPLPPLDHQRRVASRVDRTRRLLEEATKRREHSSRLVGQLPGAFLRRGYEAMLKRYRGEPLGSLVTMSGGGTPDRSRGDLWDDGSIPWVRPQDMKSFWIEGATSSINEDAIKNSSAKLIPAPAVLVVVRGMILARTWPVSVSRVDVTVNQDMKAMIPTAMDPEFLALMLLGKSGTVIRDIQESGHGTKRLPTAYLKAMKVPTPPLGEQRMYCERTWAFLRMAEDLGSRVKKGVEELAALEATVLDTAFLPW